MNAHQIILARCADCRAAIGEPDAYYLRREGGPLCCACGDAKLAGPPMRRPGGIGLAFLIIAAFWAGAYLGAWIR